MTKTVAINPQLNPLLFDGRNNPPTTKITSIIDNATPTLGNNSAKNNETKLNCKDIKATDKAMIAFIALFGSLPSDPWVKILILIKSPKTNANNNKKGKRWLKTPIASHWARTFPAVPPPKNP